MGTVNKIKINGVSHDLRDADAQSKISDLAQDLSELDVQINGSGAVPVTIDLTQYTEVNAFPYNGNWLVNAQYKGKFIACLPNRDYILKGHSTNTSIVAFLTSNSYSSGSAVPFASGWTTQASILANATETLTSPSDATYLWISTQNGSGRPNELASLVLDGIEGTDGIAKDVSDLKELIYGDEVVGMDIDLSQYDTLNAYVNGSTWFINASYKGKFVPCVGGREYEFVAHSTNTSIIAFLTSNTYSSGASVQFASGWTATQSILANNSVSIVAPSDASYIWVCVQNGTNKPDELQRLSVNAEGEKGLATIAEYPSIAEQGFPQKDLPVISFVFDDLHENDDDIVSLFNEYGIKCGFAFIASDAKIAENKDRYLAYQRQGFSILNHSINGNIINTTNYPTIASAYSAIMTAKQKLEKVGFIVNGFVAPSSAFENTYIDTLRNTHKYAYTTADIANTRSSNPCRISRESLQTTSLANILGGENVQTSIAFHIAVNRQLTFYGHSADFGTSYDGEVFNLAKIRSVVERCITLRNEGKCLILSPNQMAEYFFRGQININSNVTANRPLAPQKGMMFFDTTLNKPIWYSGSHWVDASGTNV